MTKSELSPEPALGCGCPWYVPPAVSRWRMRSCGTWSRSSPASGWSRAEAARTRTQRAERDFPRAGDERDLPVLPAPGREHAPGHRGAQHGRHTIPDIAVTITNPKYGTAVQAFATYLTIPGLASHSRPVWIINRAARDGAAIAASTGAPAPRSPPTPTPGRAGAQARHDRHLRLGRDRGGGGDLRGPVRGRGRAERQGQGGLNGGGIPRGTFDVKITTEPAEVLRQQQWPGRQHRSLA